jgi:hypothetical protein
VTPHIAKIANILGATPAIRQVGTSLMPRKHPEPFNVGNSGNLGNVGNELSQAF